MISRVWERTDDMSAICLEKLTFEVDWLLERYDSITLENVIVCKIIFNSYIIKALFSLSLILL